MNLIVYEAVAQKSSLGWVPSPLNLLGEGGKCEE